MKAINTRWIMTKKIKDEREKRKTRLVARGFEEREIGCRMEAPTCSMEGLKLCLSVIKREGWQAHSLDVKTAYLEGEAIDRNIIVRPPSGSENRQIVDVKQGHVWAQRRC